MPPSGIEGVTNREAQRAKNFFALGLVSWMYGRPTEVTEEWIGAKFASRPDIRDANLAAFRAGWNFGETTEVFAVQYEVKPAPATPGIYRNVSGAAALAWGLIAASVRSGLPLFYASYPITPASELLHELSRHKNFGVRTLQAEDEIAAANLALGAAFGGHLGVTGTSGPGMDLKSETIGLAVMLELPMVIVDVQRAGPSTGMPTKNEAADLLMAMYGRHGESPIPIVAPYTPAQCFDAAIEACRIAVTYRTPVILLSDTFLANSSEPWLIPDVDDLPEIDPSFATAPKSTDELPPLSPGREPRTAVGGARDARARAPDRRPREGGRHRKHLVRPGKPRADDSAARGQGAAGSSLTYRRSRSTTQTAPSLLVLGWGSTYGPIQAAARRVRARGGSVATAHLLHLNPLPANIGGRPRELSDNSRAGAEHGSARPDHPGRVPRSRGGDLEGPGPTFQGRRDRARNREEALADGCRCLRQEGMGHRPGAAMVSRLRRLRDSERGPGIHARARDSARAHRVRRRHRLRRPLRLLHEHVRNARHPRPRRAARDRACRGAARSLSSGSSPATATVSRSVAIT